MASELFNKLFFDSINREQAHIAECRGVWGELKMNDIVQCSRLVRGVNAMHADFEAELDNIARRNRMRRRRTCPDCGSPYCPGATDLPEGFVVIHGASEAEIQQKLLNKFGY